jgi:hypothetical protein
LRAEKVGVAKPEAGVWRVEVIGGYRRRGMKAEGNYKSNYLQGWRRGRPLTKTMLNLYTQL